MHPAEIFGSNLALIDRVTERICRRARLHDADAEDFASQVKLRLMENDYAILEKWQERSSLGTFLSVVIQRLLIDEWRARGRWQPSAEARRLGRAATMLEMMLVRDRRSLAEATAAVLAIDNTLTAADVERLVAQLPDRMPPMRSVPMAANAEESLVATQSADEGARASDVTRIANRTSHVVKLAFDAMPLDDRLLLRFRFLKSMSIADIARVMNVPQRPLYRRLESLLSALRQQLADAGVDAAALADVIGAPADSIDFGWKTAAASPSTLDVMPGTVREQSP